MENFYSQQQLNGLFINSLIQRLDAQTTVLWQQAELLKNKSSAIRTMMQEQSSSIDNMVEMAASPTTLQSSPTFRSMVEMAASLTTPQEGLVSLNMVEKATPTSTPSGTPTLASLASNSIGTSTLYEMKLLEREHSAKKQRAEYQHQKFHLKQEEYARKCAEYEKELAEYNQQWAEYDRQYHQLIFEEQAQCLRSEQYLDGEDRAGEAFISDEVLVEKTEEAVWAWISEESDRAFDLTDTMAEFLAAETFSETFDSYWISEGGLVVYT